MIQKVEKDTELAQQLLTYVENCSWIEARDHIAENIRSWVFSDWETMFAAVADGAIVGMASVMKTDYYPLPEVFSLGLQPVRLGKSPRPGAQRPAHRRRKPVSAGPGLPPQLHPRRVFRPVRALWLHLSPGHRQLRRRHRPFVWKGMVT